jgi:soluble lytic murein transglycosylase-like protein
MNRSFPDINYFIAITIALLVMWIIFSFAGVARAEIDMNIIAQIESSGNPNAVSFRGAKYGRGLYQVSEVALADYNRNRAHSSQVAPESLFDPEVGYRVAFWYISQIKRYLRHYGHEVTTNNILWAYNAGIGRVNQGIMPEETKLYIAKYERSL